MQNKSKNNKSNDQSQYKNRARGFFSASDYASKTISKAATKRGFSQSRLLTDWRLAAGDLLADKCIPVKVSYTQKGTGLGATLIVAAKGADAPEIEYMKDQLIERVNGFYGYRAISKIHINQAASGWSNSTVNKKQQNVISPDERKMAENEVINIKDAALSDALMRLGMNIMMINNRKNEDHK